MDGDLPTEDFHLISSCRFWAYTSAACLATAKTRCGWTSLRSAAAAGVKSRKTWI